MRATAAFYARMARRFEDRQRWHAAARAWREALARDDRPAAWHYAHGRVLERVGNRIGAAASYRAAIARDPRPARPYFRLGQVLKVKGEWAAAREAHREAERRNPDRAPTLTGRKGKQLKQIERIELGVAPKPAYAYGLFRAARTASALGIERVTAIELGVAGGRGLLALERHATDVESMFDVKVDLYGLDTGQGLLAPQDERDLGYHFAEGNYRMDQAALRSRLTRAELILGDAAETFVDVLARGTAPLGFVSFDMDHYTPTAAVLTHLGDAADHDRFLPRLPLYFDDVVGKRGQDYNRFTGELLAIDEFNAANDRVKIDEDRYFRSLPLNFEWHHGCYTMHRFDHPSYDAYVNASTARSLRLRR